jgi:hypothetical protein
VLGLMRTRVALVEVLDIARKVQSKALAARAEKVFETVAAARRRDRGRRAR